jgi:hypothetical protein
VELSEPVELSESVSMIVVEARGRVSSARWQHHHCTKGGSSRAP